MAGMRGSVCGTPELSWLVDILKTASGSNPMSLGKQKLRLYVRMLLRCLTDAWKTKATLIFGIDMKLQLQNADFVNYAQSSQLRTMNGRLRFFRFPAKSYQTKDAKRMRRNGTGVLHTTG